VSSSSSSLSLSLPEASSLSLSSASRAFGTNRGPASASPSPAVSWPNRVGPPRAAQPLLEVLRLLLLELGAEIALHQLLDGGLTVVPVG
jgi:hypothetical protein